MSFAIFSDEKKRIFQVTELNLAIKQLLESNVPLLWVRGEISNLVKAASGHYYFLLKDDRSQVRCVMFRHKNLYQKEPINNGQLVEVLANVTLYEQRGDFQLTVEQMRPAGLGLLYEQFERLKQTLEKEGLFATERKRRLPDMPNCIGIVTSPQAAALHDVLTTLRKRLPSVPVILYPSAVQGKGSAEQIAAAVATAGKRRECDVLIICRGGGSIEDLWSFNEEVVARAIAASSIPIVSGVGHETDFTIADFVADERAPTPTGAAQRVAPDRHALLAGLRNIIQHLQRAQRHRLQNAMQALDYQQRRLVHPAQQIQRQTQLLKQLQQRMLQAYAFRKQHRFWQWGGLAQRMRTSCKGLDRLHDRQDNAALRLKQAMQGIYHRQLAWADNLSQHLLLLDPMRVLQRGYSIAQDAEGNIVTSADQVNVDAELKVTLAQGWVQTRVLDKSRG